jgi:hypothetical protein
MATKKKAPKKRVPKKPKYDVQVTIKTLDKTMKEKHGDWIFYL